MKLNLHKSLALSMGIFFSISLFSQELSVYPSFRGDLFYQDVTEIPKQEFESLMSQNAAANELWRKSKMYSYVNTGLSLVGLGIGVWAIVNDVNDKNSTGLYIAAIAVSGVSIFFSAKSMQFRREAILEYNAEYVSIAPDLPGTPYRQLSVAYPIQY